MRLSWVFRVGSCVLFVCVQLVSSTVLTATMLSSFMGGFLMGKMTLGGFLMIMQGLNNGRNPGGGGVIPREGIDGVDRNTSEIENEIRDKFLRQLGEMDPLNCLPKVFCELSSPSKLTQFTNIKLGEEGGDDVEKDTENSEEDDETSDSEETHGDGEIEEEEMNYRIEQRKKKQNLKMEADTLDALIHESSDPMDLYFILKDKQKMRPKYNKFAASHPPFWPNKELMNDPFLKKRGRPQYTDASEYKSAPAMEARNKDIDDIFADDPFFDDFARSMKLFPETVDYRRVGRQLRRIEHETGDFRRKFRIAAAVGEKSAKSCQYVFNTCPFEANQIMAMVNTIKRKDAGEFSTITQESTSSVVSVQKNNKTKVKDPSLNETIKAKNDNLQNLRNTLLAIESINNATLLAKTAGLSVTYDQILDDAIENSNSDSTAVSSKIVDDFNKEADKMRKMAAKKASKNQKNNTNQRSKTKQRKNKGNDNKYRISRNKSKQSATFVVKRSARMSKNTKSFESSSSEESPEISFEKSPLVVKLQIPVSPVKLENSTTAKIDTPIKDTKPGEDDDNGRRYLAREEFEDDEANASDQDNLYIPEFSKFTSYKRRPLVRPQPNPENIPVVTVNGRPVLVATPTKPLISPGNQPHVSEAVLLPLPQFSYPPKKTASMEKPPRQKFTHLVEDDELDASESDKAVEKIIATRHQIKVKPIFRD